MARTLPEIIADNIRFYRKQRSMQQKDLSLATGLDQAHISRIEAGRIHPSLDVLEKVATALHVPLWQLLQSNHTDDLSILDKLHALASLPADKRTIVITMLEAFLREQELLNLRQAEEAQTLQELKALREKKSGK